MTTRNRVLGPARSVTLLFVDNYKVANVEPLKEQHCFLWI